MSLWNFSNSGIKASTAAPSPGLFSFLGSNPDMNPSTNTTSSVNLFSSLQPDPTGSKSFFLSMKGKGIESSSESIFPASSPSSSTTPVSFSFKIVDDKTIALKSSPKTETAVFSSFLKDPRMTREEPLFSALNHDKQSSVTLFGTSVSSHVNTLFPSQPCINKANAPTSNKALFTNVTTSQTPVISEPSSYNSPPSRWKLLPLKIGSPEQSSIPSSPIVSPGSASSTSIKLLQVPQECNNTIFLTQHFSKFGTVEKVLCSKKQKTAIIQFSQKRAAQVAKDFGKLLLPNEPPVTVIVWRSGSNVTSPPGHSTISMRKHGPPATMQSSKIPLKRSKGPSVDHNDAQRLALLESRDRTYRETVEKQGEKMFSRSLSKIQFKGTCTDMCPEKERYMRQEQNRISVFEVSSEDTHRIDHRLAVKEYSRSSADQDEPLCYELRTPETLQRTMLYLLAGVADQVSTDPQVTQTVRWASWYEFLWSRTRAIRKEITQQRPPEHVAIELVEKIARFHIFAACRLCEEPLDVFEPKINSENLIKCLQSLRELYGDALKNGIPCPNEAEFRSYMILTKLKDASLLSEVNHLRNDIRNDPRVQQALEAYYALYHNNYVRFFKIVERTTFLNACLLHRHFFSIRRTAISIMMQAYRPNKAKEEIELSLTFLLQQLRFENLQEIRDFATYLGHTVDGQYLRLDCSQPFREQDGQLMTTRARKVIESKVMGQRLGEILNDGPLKHVQDYLSEPHTSFNQNGELIDASETGHMHQTTLEEEHEYMESSAESETSDNQKDEEESESNSFLNASFEENEMSKHDDVGESIFHTGFMASIRDDAIEAICQQLLDVCVGKEIYTIGLSQFNEFNAMSSIVNSVVLETLVDLTTALVQEVLAEENCNIRRQRDELCAQELLDSMLRESISDELFKICNSTLREKEIMISEAENISSRFVDDQSMVLLRHIVIHEMFTKRRLHRLLCSWHLHTKEFLTKQRFFTSLPPYASLQDSFSLCQSLGIEKQFDSPSRNPRHVLTNELSNQQRHETYRSYSLDLFHEDAPSNISGLPDIFILCIISSNDPIPCKSSSPLIASHHESMEFILKWFLHKFILYPHDKLHVILCHSKKSWMKWSKKMAANARSSLYLVLVGDSHIYPHQENVTSSTLFLIFLHLFSYKESDSIWTIPENQRLTLGGIEPSAHWSLQLEDALRRCCKQIRHSALPKSRNSLEYSSALSLACIVKRWLNERYFTSVQSDKKARDEKDFVDQDPSTLIIAFNSSINHLVQLLSTVEPLSSPHHSHSTHWKEVISKRLEKLKSPPFHERELQPSGDTAEWDYALADWNEYLQRILIDFNPSYTTRRLCQHWCQTAQQAFQHICVWQEGCVKTPHSSYPLYVNAPWTDMVSCVLMDRMNQWCKQEDLLSLKLRWSGVHWDNVNTSDSWICPLPYPVIGKTLTYKECITTVCVRERNGQCYRVVQTQLISTPKNDDFDQILQETTQKLAQLKKSLQEFSETLSDEK